MSDPFLIVGVAGLAAAVAGPYAMSVVARLRGGVARVSTTALVPSRYRWTGQEIDALKWACTQIPESVTVPEFLAKMNADDMVCETCVNLLSPVKGVTK